VVCGSAAAGVATVLRGAPSSQGCLWQLCVGPLGNLPGPFHGPRRGALPVVDEAGDPISTHGFPCTLLFSHERVFAHANMGFLKVRGKERDQGVQPFVLPESWA
jgi:hypothetical protein